MVVSWCPSREGIFFLLLDVTGDWGKEGVVPHSVGGPL